MNSIIGKRRDGRIALVPSKGNAIGAVEKPNVLAGLIAWYRFEEGSGVDVADSSGNGNDGIASGGFSWVGGMVGDYAGSLNGSTGKIDAAFDESMQVSTEMSVALFVKFSSLTGFQSLLNRYNSFNGNYGWSLLTEGSNFQLDTYQVKNPPSGFYNARTTTSPLSTGVKTHICAIYDNGSIRLYKDGVQLGSLTETGSNTSIANDITEPIRIGYAKDSGGSDVEFCNAEFDDIRFYSRILTEAEIAILANQ